MDIRDAMEQFAIIVFFIGFLAVGVWLVYGAKKKIKWLVDPPENSSRYYSQAFIRKIFGLQFTIYWTYFLGFLFIVISTIAIFFTIKDIIST